MSTAGKTILVPFREDILAVTARRVIENATTLPDLGNTVILLPDLLFAGQLRKHLLDAAAAQGQDALLGPHFGTLEQWLSRHTTVEATVPGRAHRELLLAEVLKQHPGVFSGGDPWQIAASLVSLFDELTLHRIPVPDDLEAFTAMLKNAYGVSERLPEPLGVEANVVHTLWRAWHEQLAAENLLDPGLAWLQRLASGPTGLADWQVYFAGFDAMQAAEVEWATRWLQDGRAECLLYPHRAAGTPVAADPMAELYQAADTPTVSEATGFIDAVYTTTAVPPVERATTFRDQTSPLAHLRVLAARSPEQEARAIDVQVRRWLLDEVQPIAVITEDRRLARRVRALLERAGVRLQDSGGWALSTTSTAAALERWLETVEEDFAHQPLLDVLKSPFVFPEMDADALRHLVYRLEQDIIRHENIARGLSRYRHHIERRRERLPAHWPADTARELLQLLNQLDQAADPLRPFLQGAASTPRQLLQALRESLESLGMWPAFAADPAGERILQEWNLLNDAARHSAVEMSWVEFRGWFGAALEHHDFRPAAGDSPVVLLNLQQAQLGSFAAVVIGACDREYLPSAARASPFFNDPVRSGLGLPTWPDQHALQFNRFRRLLERAPRTLLTWHTHANGEARMPSAWLEALQTFHALAWSDDQLHDDELAALLDTPDSQVCSQHPLPAPLPAPFPRAHLPAEKLPQELSVSAHRILIDCPYRFFAARGLGLKAEEEVSEALGKAEYGSLVHKVLERFHKENKTPLGEAGRASAQARLEKISDEVFLPALEDNFEHRAWQRRWKQVIPEYLKWQIKRQQQWSFRRAEHTGEIELVNGHRLSGRLDRIDTGDDGEAIIDYKTGASAKQKMVDSGEDVQLASYALLTDTPPARVEYLQLDKEVKIAARLAGEALAGTAHGVKERLNNVIQAIENGNRLPAWGDPETCRYCEMNGLCRKQAWLDEPVAGGKDDPV